jgi:CRISPR-associated protein (TIGR03984 family)
MHHGVCVGLWDGRALNFHESAAYDADCVVEMRVFNVDAELRFAKVDGCVKTRYADDAGKDIFDTAYLMYGSDMAGQTEAEPSGSWICLTEQRGGRLYFPKGIAFEKGQIALWLKIRHHLKYNPVAVAGADATAGGAQTGKAALEATDYRCLGFAQGVNTDMESENYGKAVREVQL